MVVDLGELAFVDVTGLGVLEAAAGRLAGESGRMVLRSPSRPARRLLELRRAWASSDPWDIDPGR